MQLFSHQEWGAEWLAATARGCLWDEQGLGKTATAIQAARFVNAKRILVLCPTVVVHNWRREFQRWAPELAVAVLTSGVERPTNTGVTVTTHGLLLNEKLRAVLQRGPWDLVILDEAHGFRNRTAKRVRYFYGGKGKKSVVLPSIIGNAKRVWLLTGTPMPNNPSELWVPLAGLDPQRIAIPGTRVPMSFEQFRERYCLCEFSPHAKDGVKVVGVQRAAELKEKLRSFSLRRLKRDHLDLPAIRWGSVALTATQDSEQLQKAEQRLNRSDDPELNLKLAQEHPVEFSTWRRLCGLAKVQPAIDLLSDELENSPHKLVVFAHHTEVIEQLRNGLSRFGVVLITGATSAKGRQANVDTFQTSARVRVAICQIVAGGTGVTLTAASDVVFVECSFVPGENVQAADRVHRIGQSESVTVRVLTLAGSVDELLGEILVRKSAMIREVVKS